MQFLQPVFHVAQRPQQAQPGFRKVESGVQRILDLLALVNPRQLLGLGRELRRGVRPAPGAVSQFDLRQHGLQLLVGDLLLQTCDFGLGIKLAQAAGQLRNLNLVLSLRLFGLHCRPQRICRRLPCFGTMTNVKNRDFNLKSNAEVIRLKCVEVLSCSCSAP